MKSEKVKVIKEALECCKQNEIEENCKYCLECPASDWDYEKECKIDLFQKTITLIKELKSENERLLEQRNKTYNIWVKDTEKLKDRIAELEKENALIKNSVAMRDYKTLEEISNNKVKQFAERLKEKMNVREYMGVKYKQGVFSENDIDETLMEYEKCGAEEKE